MLYGYWDVFTGMTEYKDYLKQQWKRNRGYIINAIGRPMTVGDHHLKDLFSRSVQGGGHDLQMMMGERVADRVKDRNIKARPYIYDLHDATYWQVHEDDFDAYVKAGDDAAEDLWENFCVSKLGWNCKLSVSLAYGRNLKELKGY